MKPHLRMLINLLLEIWSATGVALSKQNPSLVTSPSISHSLGLFWLVHHLVWKKVWKEYIAQLGIKVTCNVRASSNILSISAWTSARQVERELERSMMARFEGLFSRDLFANEMSAITRVMIILNNFLSYYLKRIWIYCNLVTYSYTILKPTLNLELKYNLL